ncbi:MAG: glutamate racemase [Bacteroidetes bacterium]|nr:glutamate racemase [Bacteroidota bacterium]MCH8524223.1 glutamate racemase [Balneolales bacterium]
MKLAQHAPIGVFDSGIGGLTVVDAVMKTLPNENIIYFGDTARVPYGIKSSETVKEYSLQITDFLLKKKVKMILIACNSVAASSKEAIQSRAGKIPVLDVVYAGALAASAIKRKHNLLGVIGTLATVASGAYEKSLRQLDSSISVFSKACPLLVPLAEEGWTDNDVARATLDIYLKDFKATAFDGLILGCTHYPLFKHSIREYFNNDELEIIDSANSIAEIAKTYLEKHDLLNPEPAGRFDCYVSDKPQRFQALAERFLGKPINRVEVVNMP